MLASLPWAKPSAVLSALMPPEWTDDAACRDLEPEEADKIFFVERGGRTTAARALCADCQVREECLELAVAQGMEFGIFGGTSPTRAPRPCQRTPCGRGRPQGARRPPGRFRGLTQGSLSGVGRLVSACSLELDDLGVFS